ncbi:MAG: hypothetical protein VSS52_003110 [Thiotrichaceae bacterium]|nr:hypothetical protein [Thiotrichaceae bacterium]
MMEHFQFSFQNVTFLADCVQITAGFDTVAVKEELIRNHAEENGHAAIYRDALKRVDCDLDKRVEFSPTSQFLEKIGQLSNTTPSTVLGTMFATETAAIFEHEVFLDVSKEVIKRGEWGQKGERLVGFHEMHLGGVEQSHRDELGIFLKGVPADQEMIAKEGDRPTINVKQASEGADQAIEAMIVWWDSMINEAKTMSQAATA